MWLYANVGYVHIGILYFLKGDVVEKCGCKKKGSEEIEANLNEDKASNGLSKQV
jgi:hypothetical protein